MNLNRELIAYILGLLTALVVISVFLVYPLLRDIRAGSDEFVESKEKVVGVQREREHYIALREEHERSKEKFQKIDEVFANSEVPVRFIEFLEESSLKSDFPIEVSPGSGSQAKEDLWASIFFRVTGTGPFTDFSDFLEKVENSPYLLEIQTLNINKLTEEELKRRNAEGSPGDIRVDLSIKVYTKPTK